MSIISERAQKILLWIRTQNPHSIAIRQQSLAELFGCSRRSIGRALNELKAAGALTDLGKRHANRCKLYSVIPQKEEAQLTLQAQHQWSLYQKTFAIVFPGERACLR